MVKLIPPASGVWASPGVFSSVVVLDGLTFKRARWRSSAADVVAQYRQDVATNSAHLRVYRDGTWRVDHYDEVNPDFAPQAALTHLIVDHPAGRFATAYSYLSLAHAFGLLGP